ALSPAREVEYSWARVIKGGVHEGGSFKSVAVARSGSGRARLASFGKREDSVPDPRLDRELIQGDFSHLLHSRYRIHDCRTSSSIGVVVSRDLGLRICRGILR